MEITNYANLNTMLWHVGNDLFVRGAHKGLINTGEFLIGECTGLRGNGSGLTGDCTNMMGNCTGVYGNCTGRNIDLDGCSITDKERKEGVELSLLVIRQQC